MKRPDGFSSSPPRSRSADGAKSSVARAKGVARAATKRRQRAEKTELKAFTRATRHRRRVWGVSLGSIAVVVVGTVVVALSPLLALTEVRVEGANRVSSAEIRESLAGLYGEPLARVSNERVGALLEPLTVVQAFTTRVEPPGTLVLTIVERTPLGVVAQASGYEVVDAAGVVLWRETEASTTLPLILVAANPTSPSFSAVARVLVALPPEIMSQVEGITATTLDDVRFTIRQSSHEVVWGSAERSRDKARVLGAALDAAGDEAPRVIDVTTPDSVVIRARG